MGGIAFGFIFLLLTLAPFAHAWEDHSKCTRLALESLTALKEAPFEPIEKVLPALRVPGAMFLGSKTEFANALKIHEEKVAWDWRPKRDTALDVLVWSVQEPDLGMDQNWDLAPYQDTMGGTTGSSSQSIRHMVFPAFRMSAPLRTFHVPFHEMGQAHERADLFFELAVQAKRKNHDFWAYRFLGWGMHYVQDLTQPYHDSQLGSLRLLAWNKLFTREGWDGMVAETTRRVGNFHIAFELYVDLLLDREGSAGLSQALRVSRGTERLKRALENDLELSVRKAMDLIIDVGNELVSEIVLAEANWIGDLLLDTKMDLISGPRDALGNAKLDFLAIEKDPARQETGHVLIGRTYEAMSNAGIASRWYVEKFLKQTSFPE